MSDQPDLFAAPPSRRINTPIAYQATSGEAYAAIREVRGKIDKQIVAAYLANGPLSDEQAEQITGIKHQTLSGNRRHLVEDRIVMESGQFDCDENGKNRKIKWTLTPAGRILAPRWLA